MHRPDLESNDESIRIETAPRVSFFSLSDSLFNSCVALQDLTRNTYIYMHVVTDDHKLNQLNLYTFYYKKDAYTRYS